MGDCSVRICPRQCSSKGLCYNGTCFCRPGFSGLDCSKKVNTVHNLKTIPEKCVAKCVGHCNHVLSGKGLSGPAFHKEWNECVPTCNRYCIQVAHGRAGAATTKPDPDKPKPASPTATSLLETDDELLARKRFRLDLF